MRGGTAEASLTLRGPRVGRLFRVCPRCGLVVLENPRAGFCRPCAAAYQQKWNDENRDKRRGYFNQWRDQNAEYNRERTRRWQRETRDKRRDAIRAGNQRRRARIAGAPGYGYATAERIAQRVAYHGSRCRYCGSTEKLGIDHMIPLARGGGHWPSNLVPCCGSCNSSKRTKTYAEFKRWLENRR